MKIGWKSYDELANPTSETGFDLYTAAYEKVTYGPWCCNLEGIKTVLSAMRSFTTTTAYLGLSKFRF